MGQKSWTASTTGETQDLPQRFGDGPCGYIALDVEKSRFLPYTEDRDSFLFVPDGLDVAPNHYTPRHVLSSRAGIVADMSLMPGEPHPSRQNLTYSRD